ncbi:aminotransferase [Actinoalloteichus sp. AHMU CJ021]|nr:aminotransferase [Actinoalloteichus sp. AHMU CJ021]
MELNRVRADTPACEDLVFLDSAGSSLPPSVVLDTVTGHLRREAEIGGYRAAGERTDDLERGYHSAARLLGCRPTEVAFLGSAAQAWLTALDAVPLVPGDRVLISEAEYGTNAVELLRRRDETGISVETVPSAEDGRLDLAALRRMLDERVRLVSLVHMPTNGGLVNPVREAALAAHQVGALVLLDACQTVGQRPVDVDALGVDLLSATGRKWLRAPRGTGLLVVREEVLPRLRPRLVDHTAAQWTAPGRYRMRTDARVFERFEFGVANRLGLIAALDYAWDLGMEAIASEVADRAARLRAGLAALPGVRLWDLGPDPGGIVTFTVEGRPAGQVRDALWDQRVAVTVSPPNSTLLDATRRSLPDLVRASAHYFVSPDQVATAVAEVDRLTR